MATPAPGSVGWDPRARPADLERDRRVAVERAERLGRSTDEDKALRRQRRAIAKRWDHKTQATPATMEAAAGQSDCIAARTRSGALARLYATRAIDAVQLASAVDIAGVAERLARDVTTKAASWEARIDGGRRGGAAEERLGQVWREVAYTRWRSMVRGPLDAVLEMIVGETVGYTVVARRYGLSEPRARRLLINALDLWPRLFAEARRGIEQADLDRMHARLA